MNIKRFAKKHSVLVTTLTVVVVVLMAVAGRFMADKDSEVSKSNMRQVVLIEARTFRDDLSKVSVEGVVESSSQVEIRSQVSAPISQIHYSVGDSVAAGSVIVQFQNADIRAQLEQAKANLQLARGQYTSGPIAMDTNQRSAIEKIQQSYITADIIVNTQIRSFLYTGGMAEDLEKYIAESKMVDAMTMKTTEVEYSMRTTREIVDKLSESSTPAEINYALSISQKNLIKIQEFLNLINAALVDAARYGNTESQTIINNWKGIVSTARGTISAAISSLTGTGTSLSSNQAQVSAAEAGVRNLEAQLAKTIIRAPISGTIAVLSAREGEFVGMGQLVTTIVGTGGLEVKAYASSEDIGRIRKDARVTVEGSIPGTVVNVAPSVDPITKKVEVKIRIPAGERSNFVVGQNVEAKIEAVGSAQTAQRTPLYLLPIQNVKITPGEAFVFTLDNDFRVVKNKVTLGKVVGDFVEVTSGMLDDMKIVSPVYELEEGEVVRIE